MKDRYLLFIFCCALLAFCASCSGSDGLGDRGGEAPYGTGTSQIQMNIGVESETSFTTDQGYNINVESGSVSLKDLQLSCVNGQGVTEAGVTISGPFSVNLLQQIDDLGFFNGNPGDYSTFSFLIARSDSASPLQINGSATKGSLVYPFQASLAFGGRTSIGDLAVSLAVGHYSRLKLVLELPQWFGGIDFASATNTAGTIIISDQANQGIAETMRSNITGHMRIEVIND